MLRNTLTHKDIDQRVSLDGISGQLYSGVRIVREGGLVKFDNIWWEHKKLIPFVGDSVRVFIYDWAGTSIQVFPYSYGTMICITNKESTKSRNTNAKSIKAKHRRKNNE